MSIQYAMQCGHKQYAPYEEIKEKMYCNECKRARKVRAIESREWYFKCGGCRYAGYTGQSKENATTRLRVHEIKMHHHGGNVWYKREPNKSAAIRKAWGRKVRDVLIDDNKIYPDELLPLRGLSDRPIQEVILPDKPNF